MSGRQSEVLDLVRTGVATSRAELARLTGMSPSTASTRVDTLVRRGLLTEQVATDVSTGRRPRRLALAGGLGTVAYVDLRLTRSVVHVGDLAGGRQEQRDIDLRLDAGPGEVLDRVAGPLRELAADRPALQAVSLGVPGPVGADRASVVAPARMPGWNGVDVKAQAEALFGVPVVLENDANLIALGEHRRRSGPRGDLVVVIVDAGIGCGFIVGGGLYRGSGGMAGDISHTAVLGGPDIPCSCGRSGCLDVVASGSALLRALREAGGSATSTEELLGAAHDGDPVATGLLREAGQRVGVVLATVVSFLNPTDLVLAGPISGAPAFVSAVRSSVYDSCLPATTEGLDVSTLADTPVASALGGLSLATDAAFERGAVSRLLAR